MTERGIHCIGVRTYFFRQLHNPVALQYQFAGQIDKIVQLANVNSHGVTDGRDLFYSSVVIVIVILILAIGTRAQVLNPLQLRVITVLERRGLSYRFKFCD